MSFLARPSVVFAIIFGCFAVLIPRVFLPLFRSKPNLIQNQHEDRFRRPPLSTPPNQRHEYGDNVEYIPGTPPHMRGPHPGMRMHHQARPAGTTEATSSKSIVTLALPMYTVGIGVFFIYTCCKYWSKKTDECQTKNRYSKRKEKIDLDMLDQDSEEEITDKTELYAGIDPEYVEYLKLKKQKALAAQEAMTEEQKQMHSALEQMKKSLSYISSKLVNKESRSNLDTDEIFRLQKRLVDTEAQMCQILSALDTASNKVNKLTSSTQVTVKNPEKSDDEKQATENDSADESEHSSDSMEQVRSASPSSDDQSAYEDDQLIPNSQPNNNLIRRKRH